MSLYWLFLLCTVSYFIGNVNFSVICSRLLLRSDIRKSGSGNPGATNMLRNFGVKWGVAILVLDMLKGTLPALMGLLLYGIGTSNGTIAMYSCGLAAVLGHCFPVIFKFKGGKGAATTVGVFLVINPLLGAVAFVAVLLYGFAFEYASLSSILFITVCVLWEGLVVTHGIAVSVILCVFYVVILLTHRQNIRRLLTGKEQRASPLAKLKRRKMKQKQEIWLQEIQ